MFTFSLECALQFREIVYYIEINLIYFGGLDSTLLLYHSLSEDIQHINLIS